MATTSGSGIEAGAASEAAAGAATTSAPRMIVDFAGQLTGFFTFTYEGVCWAIVAALFATNWLSRTWRRRTPSSCRRERTSAMGSVLVI